MSSDDPVSAGPSSGALHIADVLLGAMGPDRSLTERVALFAAAASVGPSFEPGLQPHTRRSQISFHGSGRRSEDFSRFGRSQTAEVQQLDAARLTLVLLPKDLQSLVQREDFDIRPMRQAEVGPDLYMLRPATAFDARALPRVLD